jgi:hypothetical protein
MNAKLVPLVTGKKIHLFLLRLVLIALLESTTIKPVKLLVKFALWGFTMIWKECETCGKSLANLVRLDSMPMHSLQVLANLVHLDSMPMHQLQHFVTTVQKENINPNRQKQNAKYVPPGSMPTQQLPLAAKNATRGNTYQTVQLQLATMNLTIVCHVQHGFTCL